MCFLKKREKTSENRQKSRRALLAVLVLACLFGLSGCGVSDFSPVWFVSRKGGEAKKQETAESATKETAKEDAKETTAETAGSAAKERAAAKSASAGSVRTKGDQNDFRVEENQVEEKESRFSKSEMDGKREQIGLSEADIVSQQEAQQGNYYFGQLDPEGKILYVEIYRIFMQWEEEVLLSTNDASLLPLVYQAVINDHPELFYLNGYTYTRYMQQGSVKYITFSGRYLYDAAEVERRQAAIDKVVREKLAEFSGADSYGTVKAVYEYLILSTEYSLESPDNQNICSVFLDKKSVCNGYAKAAQYLLNRCGIPCIIVNGTALGDAHAWNIVEINGQYYQMDATWGDPSYHAKEGEENEGVPDIDYSYLGVTTKEINRNHSADKTFALPACDAIQDNYFVREGLYLYGYDEGQIGAIFGAAKAQGKTMVCIKAADGRAYLEIYDKLIGEQKIFDYFGDAQNNGEYKIAYSGNEELGTISFWE